MTSSTTQSSNKTASESLEKPQHRDSDCNLPSLPLSTAPDARRSLSGESATLLTAAPNNPTTQTRQTQTATGPNVKLAPCRLAPHGREPLRRASTRMAKSSSSVPFVRQGNVARNRAHWQAPQLGNRKSIGLSGQLDSRGQLDGFAATAFGRFAV